MNAITAIRSTGKPGKAIPCLYRRADKGVNIFDGCQQEDWNSLLHPSPGAWLQRGVEDAPKIPEVHGLIQNQGLHLRVVIIASIERVRVAKCINEEHDRVCAIRAVGERMRPCKAGGRGFAHSKRISGHNGRRLFTLFCYII